MRLHAEDESGARGLESNRRPIAYKASALPTELHGHVARAANRFGVTGRIRTDSLRGHIPALLPLELRPHQSGLRYRMKLALPDGFEPPSSVLETEALPLDDGSVER